MLPGYILDVVILCKIPLRNYLQKARKSQMYGEFEPQESIKQNAAIRLEHRLGLIEFIITGDHLESN